MITFDSVCTKRVSYVLPTIGRRQHMLLALHNLADLKTEQDEVVVIDCSDNEETQRLAEAWTPLVDTYIHERELGIGLGFNRGILLARGRLIRLMADDDITYPRAMAQAVAIMENDSSIDMLYCRIIKHLFGEAPLLTRSLADVDYSSSVWGPVKYGACGVGYVFRRKACAVVGLMLPRSLAQDVEYVMRFIARDLRVVTSDLVLAYHPTWSHSEGVLNPKCWCEDFVKVCQAYGMPAHLVEKNGDFEVLFEHLPGK